MNTQFKSYYKKYLNSEQRLVCKHSHTPSQTPSEEVDIPDNQRLLAELIQALKTPEGRKQAEEILRSLQEDKEEGGNKQRSNATEQINFNDVEKKLSFVINELREHISNSTLERKYLVENHTVIICMDKLNKIFHDLNDEMQGRFMSKFNNISPFMDKNGKLFFIDSYQDNGKIRFWLYEITRPRNMQEDESDGRGKEGDPSAIRPEYKLGSVPYLKMEMQKDLEGIQSILDYWGYEKCPKDHLQKIVNHAAKIFSQGGYSQDVMDMFMHARFNDPHSGKEYQFVRDGKQFVLFES